MCQWQEIEWACGCVKQYMWKPCHVARNTPGNLCANMSREIKHYTSDYRKCPDCGGPETRYVKAPFSK